MLGFIYHRMTGTSYFHSVERKDIKVEIIHKQWLKGNWTNWTPTSRINCPWLADLLTWRTWRCLLTIFLGTFLMKSDMFTKPSAQLILHLAHQAEGSGKFNFSFIREVSFHFVGWLCSVEETLEDQAFKTSESGFRWNNTTAFHEYFRAVRLFVGLICFCCCTT